MEDEKRMNKTDKLKNYFIQYILWDKHDRVNLRLIFKQVTNNNRKIQVMDNGLIIENIEMGQGSEAKEYNKITVNYTGKLEDGSIFDSSLKKGRDPFTFTLGVGSVIKGWDLGVKGMKVGGKRKLTIPPELGYGDQGAGTVIPPGATLVFEIELLSVEDF